jgi:hypothetical protein
MSVVLLRSPTVTAVSVTVTRWPGRIDVEFERCDWFGDEFQQSEYRVEEIYSDCNLTREALRVAIAAAVARIDEFAAAAAPASGPAVVIQEQPLPSLKIGIFRGEQLAGVQEIRDERVAFCRHDNRTAADLETGLVARPIVVSTEGGAE